MKTHLLLSVLFILSLQCSAQLNCEGVQYEVTTFTEDYNDLDVELATSLSEGIIWDDPTWQFPIGFDFTYYNFTTSELLILGDLLGAGVVGNPNGLKSAANVFLPGYADYTDLGYATGNEGEEGGLSNVSYLTDGEAGSQVLKLEWNNVGFYEEVSNGTANYFMNLQMWLYESDQSIEFRYGSSNIPDSAVNFVFDGLNSPLSALVCSLPFGEGEITGVALVGPSDSPVLEDLNEDILTTFDDMPESGRVYRFEKMLVPGLFGNSQEQNFTVYPNPFTDNITIESGSAIDYLWIEDLTGKKVYSLALQSTKSTFSLAELPSGVYFVNVQTAQGVITEKIIK